MSHALTPTLACSGPLSGSESRSAVVRTNTLVGAIAHAVSHPGLTLASSLLHTLNELLAFLFGHLLQAFHHSLPAGLPGCLIVATTIGAAGTIIHIFTDALGHASRCSSRLWFCIALRDDPFMSAACTTRGAILLHVH